MVAEGRDLSRPFTREAASVSSFKDSVSPSEEGETVLRLQGRCEV